MNTTKSIHLTDMSRELKNDRTGHYRQKILGILERYQRQLNHTNVPGNLKTVFASIQQAMTHARTILTSEE